jgi:hypothetical protein
MSTTGTITIHPPSRPGLTCTVEYPNGTTKEWREETVRARGFEVPVGRETFGVLDASGGVREDLYEVWGADLRDGDKVVLDGESVAITDVTRTGRDVTFRVNGFRRKASAYRRVTLASS